MSERASERARARMREGERWEIEREDARERDESSARVLEECSSDTVERLATGKQNVTITICARSARGKINDLTLSAGTSAPSHEAAIAHGRGDEGGRADVKVTSSFAQ